MIAKLRNSFILFSICLMMFAACDRDDNQPKPLRKVQFKIAIPSNGKTAAAFNPDALLISIEDLNGVSFYSLEKVEIYQLNDGYISVPVSLPQGSYQLTLFALTDADDNIIAATPTEDSPVAEFVTDPLPIEFEVTTEETTYLTPEVIVIQEGIDVGYAQFGIEIIKVFPITVNVFGNEGDIRIPVSASLSVEGYKSGSPVWTKTVGLLADTNSIYMKEMEYYYFKIESPGYYPWAMGISFLDLKNNPNQVFDLFKVETQLKSITTEVYCCPGSGFVPTKMNFLYNSQHQLVTTSNLYQLNNQWYTSSTVNNTYSGGLVPTQVKYNFTGGTYTTFSNTVTSGIITEINTFNTASGDMGNYIISLTRDPNTNRITDAILFDTDYNSTLYYHYVYDGQGDLVMFEARQGVNSDLLYRGEFTYDSYSNVYPQHILGNWLESMTNAGYDRLLHIPFMINKPKHNIVGYTLSMFTGTEILYSKETITMNYSYDNQGRPSSLGVQNVIEMPGYATVDIERQKNTVFQYN